MANNEIDSLKEFNETSFKRLGLDRQEWLLSGKDMLVNPNYVVNKLSHSYFGKNNEVVLKRIIKENEYFKTFVLSAVHKEALPEFHAGQRIAVTFLVDGKYITRPFSLCSTSSDALDGEYRILVYNHPDDALLQMIYEGAKVGDRLTTSSPFGDFYFNSLRDSNHVIAIVSEAGIAPIYSMVQDIISKEEDFNLTVFYTVKRYSDLLFVDELNEYDDKSDRFHIIYVLSEEEHDNCLKGYVTCELLQEYMKDINSFFLAGGEGMLKYLNKELEKLQLPKKFIRYDEYLPKCNIRKVVEYSLTIYINDEKYETKCYNNRTIMDSITESGIFIPSKCHNGSCGYCNSELVLGKVKVVNDKRNEAMKKNHYIHPCCTYPLSDIEIVVR